jgi:hypothetical protein
MIFGTLKVLLFIWRRNPKPNIFVLFKFGFKSVWVVLETCQRVRFQRLNIHSFIPVSSSIDPQQHNAQNKIKKFDFVFRISLKYGFESSTVPKRNASSFRQRDVRIG